MSAEWVNYELMIKKSTGVQRRKKKTQFSSFASATNANKNQMLIEPGPVCIPQREHKENNQNKHKTMHGTGLLPSKPLSLTYHQWSNTTESLETGRIKKAPDGTDTQW